MISSETWRGKRMKGEVPSILGKERPMSPHNSSSMWRSQIGMEHHQIPCGGCIGVDIPPPLSTTKILESISAWDILTWLGGTTISRRCWSCLRCFFLARQRQRWNTVAQWASAEATDAHCVRSEEFAQDLKNTWTQGGGGGWCGFT